MFSARSIDVTDISWSGAAIVKLARAIHSFELAKLLQSLFYGNLPNKQVIESNLFTLNFILRKDKRGRRKKKGKRKATSKKKKKEKREKRKIKGEVKKEEKSDIYPINHVIN